MSLTGKGGILSNKGQRQCVRGLLAQEKKEGYHQRGSNISSASDLLVAARNELRSLSWGPGSEAFSSKSCPVTTSYQPLGMVQRQTPVTFYKQDKLLLGCDNVLHNTLIIAAQKLWLAPQSIFDSWQRNMYTCTCLFFAIKIKRSFSACRH